MLTKIRNKGEKGFSLLELAVAVGIAAIVASVAVTASTVFVNGSQTKADNYVASADSEINNAKASFDGLGGDSEPASIYSAVFTSTTNLNNPGFVNPEDSTTQMLGDSPGYNIPASGGDTLVLETTDEALKAAIVSGVVLDIVFTNGSSLSNVNVAGAFQEGDFYYYVQISFTETQWSAPGYNADNFNVASISVLK